jgi:hypothetical protein
MKSASESATCRETAPLYNPRTRLSGQIRVSASFDLNAKSKVIVCEALLQGVQLACEGRALRIRSRLVEPTGVHLFARLDFLFGKVTDLTDGPQCDLTVTFTSVHVAGLKT